MKRLITLLLVLCLLLCACGGGSAETPTTTQESTSATTEATTQETTVETQPALLYQNPLTGEAIAAPYTGRPTAVVINNIKACLPQAGISSADIVYEVETEGGITRLLAIFTDLAGIQKIGPVRSARTFFNDISSSYDVPLIHCGGSNGALNGMYDDTHYLDNWEHVDQRFNGSYFFRDQNRKAQGYATEHTLFTTGDMLVSVLAKKNLSTVYETPVNYGLQFSDAPALEGESGNIVTVKFTGNKTTTMTFNAQSGLYEASQYKQAQIDENTGKTMTYRNVLVLQTSHWKIHDGTYSRSYYDLIGDGEGYFACDGKIVPIKWSRSSVSDPFVFTLKDGTPITLGVGTSYIGVISTKASVAYE